MILQVDKSLAAMTSVFTLLSFLRHLTWTNLLRTIQLTGRQRLMGLAAEMAFNSVLALVPTIVMVLSAIVLFAAPQSVLQQWTNSLGQIIPMDAALLLRNLITAQSSTLAIRGGLLPLSLFLALWAASSTMQTAMGALDQIQQVSVQQRRSFWMARLVAIGLTLAHVLLFVSASFLIFISDLVIRVVARYSGILETPLLGFWSLVSGPLALLLVAIAFALIYRFGPSRWRSATPILPGALIASFSWAQLSLLFRRYVELFGHYDQFYGVLGAVIVLMLWLQLTSLVMLIGHQLNVIVGQSMGAVSGPLVRTEPALTLVEPPPPRSTKRRRAKSDPFEPSFSGPATGTKRSQKPRQTRKRQQNPLQQPWHHGEESESPYDPDA